TLTETIGFRSIRLVNGEGFHLNGKRTLLRGTVHHEFWPDSGRTGSRQQAIDDIELMKSMNMNTVRRAHYPASRAFYEEADRLGILVLDELGGWQKPPYDDQIAPGLVRELVIRDVNHPCIFAWDNGNEGGFNFSVDDDYGIWDPQKRRVLHPANWEADTTGGVRTHHYATYDEVAKYLGAGKTVYMPTEIQHGLYDGGGGAGLEDHWKAMRAAPNSGGMFIWSLLDEGLVRDDRDGAIDMAGDRAPDGILGPYRQKEASYHTVKALWSPVQVAAPNLTNFTGSVAVENRFDFTDLNQCTFRWQLGWFPDPTNSPGALNAGFIVSKESGTIAGPSAPPGTVGSLNLGVPADWLQYDALRLTASDPHGRGIYTWMWPLQSAAQICDRVVVGSAKHPGASGVITTGAEIIITNGNQVVRFDKTNGRLNGAAVDGRLVSLKNGPRPVAGSWVVTNITHGLVGNEYVITVNDVTSAPDGFQWRIQSNGWLRLLYRYTLVGTQNWFGVTFDYPGSDVTSMRWLGQGPHRVWKNRLPGQEVAVHYKTANRADTGPHGNHPEFPGYHGQLHWAALESTGGQRLILATPTANLFFRVLTPPVASVSRLGVSPPFPPGDLSVLHAINAIGNKFQLPGANTTGPLSANPIATGLYTGELWFFLGAHSPAD
ncbi:MAG: glycoside hydrolase family 2, partial [Akkermansiaceae bacterium]|nr:glycoside hydrolase family 2 [Verrucomicrobiales bacterium]